METQRVRAESGIRLINLDQVSIEVEAEQTNETPITIDRFVVQQTPDTLMKR
jgi:hypothetical protein